jgi:hypothetical protein
MPFGGQPAEVGGLQWAMPDYMTLWRRRKTITVQIPFRRADGPLDLLMIAPKAWRTGYPHRFRIKVKIGCFRAPGKRIAVRYLKKPNCQDRPHGLKSIG